MFTAPYATSRKQLEAAAELERAKWLQALLHDHIRALMHLQKTDHAGVRGLATMLQIACVTLECGGCSQADPLLLTMREAIEHAEALADSHGYVSTAGDAELLGHAVDIAFAAVRDASVDAIIVAAAQIAQQTAAATA